MGPFVDQNLMTSLSGLYSCGNALHVNDLVDYVSKSGGRAGASVAEYALSDKSRKKLIPLVQEGALLYTVPQFFDLNKKNKTIIYFRSSRILKNARFRVFSRAISSGPGGKEYINIKYSVIKPPEMKRVIFNPSGIERNVKKIIIRLEEEGS